MLDLRTGKEMTRRETIKGGLGLAAILAAGEAPAYLLGARGVAFGNEPYVTDHNILHLDGILNGKTGHLTSSNTWYDLSGNGNDCVRRITSKTDGWDSNCAIFTTNFDESFFARGFCDYTFISQITGDFTYCITFSDTSANRRNYNSILGATYGDLSDYTGFYLGQYTNGIFNCDMNNSSASQRREKTIGGVSSVQYSTITPVNTIVNAIVTVKKTQTGTENALYKNGQMIASATFNNGYDGLYNTDFSVGSGWRAYRNSNLSGGYVRPFNGRIYDVFVYNKCLSPSEVRKNTEYSMARFSA